jgi:catechol 2,3-dioxygenase-like lactoylglutathione lyase family enzyme
MALPLVSLHLMDFLSHISFSVSDFQKSLKFYDAVLGELGHKRMYTNESGAGWGTAVGREFFEIKKRVDKISNPSKGFHLAFHASKKENVHGFYEQAIKHGGRDNGLPGPRPEYGSDYYAAFVIDPDGYELEIKLFV